MKKILFPFEIDNPLYKEAYIYAVKFARNMNAELIMLNVFSIEVSDDITQESYNKLIKNSWFKAYNEVVELNNFYFKNHIRIDQELSIKFDYRFIHGKLIEEIRRVTREEPIDLIVLPISDTEEINKKQLEIIRDDIFEKNRTSLLVVPQHCPFKPIKNIVFATDLKKLNYHQLYLNDVLKYAKIFDSNIHFIHISNRDEKTVMPEDVEAYRTMTQIIETNKRHVFKSFYGENLIESVKQYSESKKGDLLVVVKHQHYFLDTLFHRSFSDEISLKSTIPVLVMREKMNKKT